MPIAIAKKLKINEREVLLTISAPADFVEILGALPAGVKITNNTASFSQIHWFVRDKKQLEAELQAVLSKISGDVICWIYFPKGSSGIQTDLTRDKGWEKLLAEKDLKWLTLISLNDTWSGFAMRRLRSADEAKVKDAPTREIFNWVDPVKKLVNLPEPLQAAFSKNKKALEAFQALSFTNKKEYVEWIVTAKRNETRSTRIHETIERLLKGWKNPRNL